jgi:hypothetical protein
MRTTVIRFRSRGCGEQSFTTNRTFHHLRTDDARMFVNAARRKKKMLLGRGLNRKEKNIFWAKSDVTPSQIERKSAVA